MLLRLLHIVVNACGHDGLQLLDDFLAMKSSSPSFVTVKSPAMPPRLPMRGVRQERPTWPGIWLAKTAFNQSEAPGPFTEYLAKFEMSIMPAFSRNMPLLPCIDEAGRLAGVMSYRSIVHHLGHAGTAKAVDRRARNLGRKPGQQQRHTRYVAVVFAGLVGASEDHVVDRLPIDRGMALDKRLERNAAEVIGPHRRQGTAVTADGSANVVADKSIAHFSAP